MTAMLVVRDDVLYILDCYEEKNKLKREGGVTWDGDMKRWYIPFTIANYNRVVKCLKNPRFEPFFDEALEKQHQKEQKLNRIIDLSKTDTPVKLRVPGLKLPLFNYQKLGVAFSLANNDGVLIADEMGLGKTVQAIATACFMKYNHGIQSCLCVVPASVKWNWPLELEKFTDEPYIVIDGPPVSRVKQWLGQQACRRLKSGKYEYYKMPKGKKPFFTIVNYELITEDLFGGRNITVKEDDSFDVAARKVKTKNKAKLRQAALKPIQEKVFDCIVIDEAHMIKSRGSKRSKNLKKLQGKFRIALTGTPMDGRLEELHSVMQFVKPGLFMPITRFMQKHADFDYWGRVVRYKHIEEVRDRIRPFFIRRLKKDVLKDLPDKTYQNRYIELSTRERKIYKAIAARAHECSEDAEAMVKVIRCKQFCDTPELVGEDCPSSKLSIFMDIVDELVKYNTEKLIVFSQYEKMIQIIEREIAKAGLKYLKITGPSATMKQRAAMQAQFNEDPEIDVILGTEAMALGLNLTGGSYVINYDDNWAPAIMRQREDRSHRHGQKQKVTVINFICMDTIEERIRDVLYGKELVSTETLGDDTDEMVLKRLGPQEIAKLA